MNDATLSDIFYGEIIEKANIRKINKRVYACESFFAYNLQKYEFLSGADPTLFEYKTKYKKICNEMIQTM